VNSLTKLAPVILFSASVPRQARYKWAHPNEQWPDYWVNKFKQKGFIVVDCIRRKIWLNDNVAWFYRQNILIFVKSERLQEYPLLKTEREKTFESQISIVHPRFFDIWSDLENLPLNRLLWILKEILLTMPITVRRGAKNRINRLFHKG